VIRIGAGSGWSGDDPRGAEEVVGDGVDVLCCEALAEMTMHWLHGERRADPRGGGWARDLLRLAETALPAVARGMKLVANAGGLNPPAAAAAVRDLAARLGLRIATVHGGDLAGCLDAEALSDGADVVVTGRVADAALFMAPAIAAHGVADGDWGRLGRLAAVGHLLECSTQVTGGNFSGAWWTVEKPEAVGFPIAEVDEAGDAVITKPAGSGGLVSIDTVKEQMLYEVGDPSRYITPDVVADFSSVTLSDAGADRVAVRGARGSPRTMTYKALLSRPVGWMGSTSITYTWPAALAKARAAARILTARLERAGVRPLETLEEYLGTGAVFGESDGGDDAPEVVLRYAVHCSTAEEARVLIDERMRVLSLAGPPAMGGAGAGLGGVMPLYELLPTLVPRELVDAGVSISVETVT
jgi:hypothetical protein